MRDRINLITIGFLLMGTALLPVAVGAADIMHNSAGTGSSRWSANGGWGVSPTSKYGEFTCSTCHEPNSKRIKNVRSIINSMNGDLLPNGATSVSVVLNNVTSMGDDSKAHTSSNRICEVCHSQLQFHNADSSRNSGGLGHPNPKSRCTSCHAHSTGFKASCGGCHGNPPTTATLGSPTGFVTPPTNATDMSTPGAHEKHTSSITGRGMVCDTCHSVTNGGTRMPSLSKTIQIGFFGFGGKVTSGTYTAYSSLVSTRFASGTPNTTMATAVTSYAEANQCANVYCHGGGVVTGGTQVKAPLSGGSNKTPFWMGSGQASCGSCHGASAANPPTMGSHVKHASSAAGNYGMICDTCHPSSADNSHVQGNARWQLNTSDPKVGSSASYRGAAGGSTGELAPSAAYGQCANLNCHSDGRGGQANIPAPTWGDATGFLDCAGCHGGAKGAAVTMSSGAHKAHVDNTSARFNNFNFKCNECHNAVVNGTDSAIIATGLHVNQVKNVDWGTRSSGGGAYSGGACDAIYCHSNGKGVFKPPAAAWTAVADGTQGTANCDYCHNGLITDATPMNSNRHYNHIATSPVGGVPHRGVTCDVCHDLTVAPGGTSILASGGEHIDNGIEVNFAKFANRSGSYTVGTQRCSVTYCHASTTVRWTTTTINTCGSCHASTNTTSSGLSTAHIKHYNSATAPANSTTAGWMPVNNSVTGANVFMCGTCHPNDPNVSHINGPANPLNGSAAEVVLTLPFTLQHPEADIATLPKVARGAGQTADGKGYYYSTGTTCNVYCHSDGRGGAPKAVMSWASTTSNCGNCHNKAGDANPTWSGSHTKHMGSAVASVTCNACHAATASSNTTLSNRRNHPNGFRNVSGNATAGVFSWNGTSCSNAKCHYGNAPTWGGAPLATDCSGCHGGPKGSAAPMTKNAHKAHTDNTSARFNGFNFTCNECHATVVNGSNAIVGQTLHINNAKDVSWGPVSAGGLAYSGGNCSQIYCHSNGKAVYKAPATAWTAVADGTQGSVGCDYCHNGLISDATPMSSNRHYNHIATSPAGGVKHKAITCDVCHDLTVAPGGTSILASGGHHIDKGVEVNFTKFANRSGSYTAGTQRCSVTYCHASTTVTWTTTTINTCGSCHAATNTTSSGLSTAHIKHYNSSTAPVNSTIAGWMPVNNSGTGANVFMCGTCHPTNPDVSHINGPANPVNGSAAEVVLTLPFTLQYPEADIVTLPKVARGAGQTADGKGYYYSTGTTCNVYCHSDGRGGAPKAVMSWASTTSNCGNCHNKAGDASPTWSGAHTKHLGSNVATVTCNACHAATASNNTTLSNRRNHPNGFRNVSGNAAAGPFRFIAGTTCNSVKCHSDGKGGYNAIVWTGGPLDCKGCHGDNGTSLFGEPDYTTGSAGSLTANSHAKHVKNAADCGICHNSTSTTGTSITGTAAHINGTLTVVLAAAYDTNGTTANWNGALNTKTCSATTCHGGTTVTWGGSLADAAQCDSCHGGNRSSTSTVGLGPVSSGKHTAHLNNADAAMGSFACGRCHAATVTTGNDRAITGALHANNVKNVSYDSLNPAGTAGACTTLYCHSDGKGVYVNQTLATAWVGATVATCKSCHGTGAASSYGEPSYTNSGIGQTTSNSHTLHKTPLGIVNTTGCAYCHDHTVNSTTANVMKPYSTHHIDGGIDLNFKAGTGNGTSAYLATVGVKKCSNTSCHGGSSPSWGGQTANSSCTKCHGQGAASPSEAQLAPGYNGLGKSTDGNSAASDPRVGAHDSHVRAPYAYAKTFACAECHAKPTAATMAGHSYEIRPGTTSIVTFANSSTANLKYGVKVASQAQYSSSGIHAYPAAGGCSSTWCHGSKLVAGARFGRNTNPTWNDTNYLTGVKTAAGDCGVCHGSPPNSPSHDGSETIAAGARSCNSCHSNVSVTGSFADPKLHINGKVEAPCNACHDYDTTGGGTAWGKTNYSGNGLGGGSHAKHIEYIKARWGIALNAASDSFGALGNAGSVCGVCHTNTLADHTTSAPSNPRSITFALGGRQFGTLAPLYNGNSATVTTKNCSNIDCHYMTSPVW